MACTVAVAFEFALAEPKLFDAVTVTRSRLPTSAVTIVYRRAFAPPIAPQFAALESHRSHWYLNDVGELCQLPFEALRIDPSRAVPEMPGSAASVGALPRAATTPVAADVAATAPAAPPKPASSAASMVHCAINWKFEAPRERRTAVSFSRATALVVR